jgi:hypothetical protein
MGRRKVGRLAYSLVLRKWLSYSSHDLSYLQEKTNGF